MAYFSFTDSPKVDGTHWPLALYFNEYEEALERLAAGAALAEFVDAQTISSTWQLDDNDASVLAVTASGADQTVELAPEASTNHSVTIINAGATYNVIVKDDSGSTTLVTLEPGAIGLFVPSGSSWYYANAAGDSLPSQSGNSGKLLSTNGTSALWIDRDWNAVSESWTRTGDHTFTVSGDLTGTYTKGRKVRYKDGGSYEYGVIASSSYSAPNTTVTLITNSSYAMAAATITDRYLSDAQNPSGWPDWFEFSPTPGASGAMTYTSVTISFCKWRHEGGRTIRYIGQTVGITGGTADRTLTVTLPVNAIEGANLPTGVSWVADGGYGIAAYCYLTASLINGRKSDSSNFGLGSSRYFNFNAVYEF